MDRKAQEVTIQHDLGKIEQQYECAICLNWLDEPVLTRCGHRFCKKCIESSLKTEFCVHRTSKQCPLDSTPLEKTELFPDNFTRREIRQILVPCPNETNGCAKRMSPYERDAHVAHCKYGPESVSTSDTSIPCHFTSCGCSFEAADEAKLQMHIQREVHAHLNMLLKSFTQNKAMALKSIEAEKMWDAPSKSSDGQNGGGDPVANHKRENDALLSALYERIVVLEQLSREQGMKIDKLTTQLNRSVTTLNDMTGRHSNGILLWKITHFRSKLQAMINNASIMYYSHDVYTGPFGYRFCARINVSPKAVNSIGLHLHMMQSENDYHLDWPFRGAFKFWMLHRDSNLTKADKIMSNEKLAFARPQLNISPCGFGYLEYANISEIISQGFVADDTLTIKIHIGIV